MNNEQIAAIVSAYIHRENTPRFNNFTADEIYQWLESKKEEK